MIFNLLVIDLFYSDTVAVTVLVLLLMTDNIQPTPALAEPQALSPAPLVVIAPPNPAPPTLPIPSPFSFDPASDPSALIHDSEPMIVTNTSSSRGDQISGIHWY